MATEGQIVVGVDGEKHIFHGGRWQPYLDLVESSGVSQEQFDTLAARVLALEEAAEG